MRGLPKHLRRHGAGGPKRQDPMPSRDLIWALGLRMQHGGPTEDEGNAVAG